MTECPFHGAARLASCGHCRRAYHAAYKARQTAIRARARLDRPPPTDNVYRVDHPEKSTAEDVLAILMTIKKEFRR